MAASIDLGINIGYARFSGLPDEGRYLFRAVEGAVTPLCLYPKTNFKFRIRQGK